MDTFFSWLFCALLVLCLTTCTGCSLFGSEKLTDEEFIEVVTDAGCVLKHVDRDEGEVGDVDCFDIVRHVR